MLLGISTATLNGMFKQRAISFEDLALELGVGGGGLNHLDKVDWVSSGDEEECAGRSDRIPRSVVCVAEFSPRGGGHVQRALSVCGMVLQTEVEWPYFRGRSRPGEEMNEVTRILSAIEGGESHATDKLLPLVYEELRKLAAAKLALEAPGQTIQATALVHEAYLRLVGVGDKGRWDNREHFFAAAAEAMRRILVENARRKQAVKHGGGRQRVPLQEFHRVSESPEDLLDLDDALTRFAAEEPDKARLVQLRFFAGLSMPEAAAALGISLATAERWWTFARAWLYSELEGDEKKSALP